MRATRDRDDDEEILVVDGDRLEKVTEFKYLGSTVTSQNCTEVELQLRIGAASRCSRALNRILKSRSLSKRTEIQVFTAIIRPILLYGCETWRMTKEMEHQIGVFERSIMRRIFGPVRDEETGEWRWRHNEDLHLMALAGIPAIGNILRSFRLRWACHVARMPAARTPRHVMLDVPQGRRPVGRPKKRWTDNLKEDLTALGVHHRRWMEAAAEKRDWRGFVRAARDFQGPRPPE